MTHQEPSIIERLCEAGSPYELNDWEDRDGYYVAACRVTAEDVTGLIDIARKWSDLDWPTNADVPGIVADDAGLLPVTAWRTLADLKADSAVEPLVGMLLELDDGFDDWAAEELPHVFGKIGEPSVEALTRLANDDRAQEFVRSIAVRGLRCVADYHPHTRDRVVACLTDMMAGAREGDFELNTTLMVELVELRAVEAAEPIERAFAGDLIDVGMMGDWETVRSELGVEGLGLKMPESPNNSLDELQTRIGIGLFSAQPIFGESATDEDAEQASAWPATEAPTAIPSFSQSQRVGRNEPCPCGSGKKYKKCCR